MAIHLRIVSVGSLLLAACAPLPHAGSADLPIGARYVAMGSSYAAGPGVTRAADARDPRCSRSIDNYPHQVARALELDLVDVSCSGATTGHVLEGWNELPPQVDAVTPETALVTVTIGGNDLDYVGRLFAGSCGEEPVADAVRVACVGMRARQTGSPPPSVPDEAAWTATEAGLAGIAAEVRRRAPRARLIFVEYLSAVPSGAPCAAVPLSPTAATVARETVDRLARVTETVARRAGAEILPITELSRDHNACGAEPWITGFVPATTGGTFVPYHPNLAGMSAIATSLIARLHS